MSIVAMKRKSGLKNLSRENGFSTAGVNSLSTYIGKVSIFSTVSTPFKGDLPKGHGGTNGTYVVNIICNDKERNIGKIISTSSKNTSYVLQKLKKHDWVKKFNPLDHQQSRYIKELKVKATCRNNHIQPDAGNRWCSNNCKNLYHIGGKKYSRSAYNKNIADKAMDSSQYTDTLLLKKHCLPTPACKQPFPFSLQNKGCNTFYKTPQEAIDAGLLPSDWMNCGN